MQCRLLACSNFCVSSQVPILDEIRTKWVFVFLLFTGTVRIKRIINGIRIQKLKFQFTYYQTPYSAHTNTHTTLNVFDFLLKYRTMFFFFFVYAATITSANKWQKPSDFLLSKLLSGHTNESVERKNVWNAKHVLGRSNWLICNWIISAVNCVVVIIIADECTVRNCVWFRLLVVNFLF